MTVTRIALAGIGKIARDQHVPTIAASDRFELVAAITGHEPPEGVPGFRTIGEMMRAVSQVDAVSICTPPRGRLALVAEALEHGLDVMIEKPPAATLSEAEIFAALAHRADRVLYVGLLGEPLSLPWLIQQMPQRLKNRIFLTNCMTTPLLNIFFCC